MTHYLVYDKNTMMLLREGHCHLGQLQNQVRNDNEAVTPMIGVVKETFVRFVAEEEEEPE